MGDEDEDTPALILEEARHVVQRQYQSGQNMDDKAAQVLRFDALALGLLLTAISLLGWDTLSEISAAARRLVVLAMFLLATSALLAVYSYQVTRYSIGLHDFEKALDAGLDREVFHKAAAYAYARGVTENHGSLQVTARFLTWALGTLASSIVVLVIAATVLLVKS